MTPEIDPKGSLMAAARAGRLHPRWHTLAILLLAVVLMAACQPAAPPEELTGVLLQASYQVPDELSRLPLFDPFMNYLLYLPDTYYADPERDWPVIFYLHGSGSGPYTSEFLMTHGVPEIIYSGDLPDDFPFIVVAPQAWAGGTWWMEGMPALLISLLDDVLERYRADPERVYLMGVSMGGYGSWYIGSAFPERFAAMVSVSGSGYRNVAVPDPEEVCRMEDLPVWAIHGRRDMISDMTFSKLAAVALLDCGGEVVWTQYEDAGHFETTTLAHREPELFSWLLEHRRERGGSE